jgi:hypothetical protein
MLTEKIMRKLCLMIALILVTVTAGPIDSRADDDKTLAKPDVLGEENILTTKHLAAYDTVIIKDFDIKSIEYEKIDDDEKKDVEPVVDTLPKIISSSFVHELKGMKKFKSVESNTSKKGKTLMLEGKITRLSGGHGAAKFFLGIMTPQSLRTHIAISGRLIDVETGKDVATFNDVKSGVTGAGMGFLKEVFVNLSGDLGRDLAEFVVKLY